jgi:hypothetical protein
MKNLLIFFFFFNIVLAIFDSLFSVCLSYILLVLFSPSLSLAGCFGECGGQTMIEWTDENVRNRALSYNLVVHDNL